MPRTTLLTLPARPRGTASAFPLARSLGIVGWDALDAVLLAAVITESPVLVMGPPGCGRGLFLLRLARCLGWEFHRYDPWNPPVSGDAPANEQETTGRGGRSSRGSVPSCAVVSLDDFDLARPDVQRQLVGMLVERPWSGDRHGPLHLCWAVASPGCPLFTAGKGRADAVQNLGVGPVLLERFDFYLRAPAWQGLTNDEREALLAPWDFAGGVRERLPALVKAAREGFRLAQEEDPVALRKYLVQLEQFLWAQGITLSTHRIRVLYRNTLAIHAAARALEGFPLERGPWRTRSMFKSAYLALCHSLPQQAFDDPPEPALLEAVHGQAWAGACTRPRDIAHRLMGLTDPVTRLVCALRSESRLQGDTLGSLILDCLSRIPGEEYKTVAAIETWRVVRIRPGAA